MAKKIQYRKRNQMIDWSAVFERFLHQKLHRIELSSIWCKFLIQVCWVCVTPVSQCVTNFDATTHWTFGY